MYATLKILAIILTMAGGILGLVGSPRTTDAAGRWRFTPIGRISLCIILAGGLLTYLMSVAEKAEAQRAARMASQWDVVKREPIRALLIEVGVNWGNVKVKDLSDVATSTSVRFLSKDGRIDQLYAVQAREGTPEGEGALRLVATNQDGIVVASAPGQLWTQYPTSGDWLCWWSTEQPSPKGETWACSWRLEITWSDAPFKDVDNLANISEIVVDTIGNIESKNYEARMFPGFDNMYVSLSLYTNSAIFDLSPQPNEQFEYVDERGTAKIEKLRARMTGPELQWKFRRQFEEKGGLSGFSGDPPLHWKLQYLVASWLNRITPTWLASYVPDLSPEVPRIVERSATGRVLGLSGYYPRPPTREEREAYARQRSDGASQ